MFRGDIWNFKHIVPSNQKGWSWLVVAKGDVRESMDKSYSPYTTKRLETATLMGELHTVIRMRDGDIVKLKRAGGCSALRNCLLIIMSEQDGRRFFPTIFTRADSIDEIKAKKTRRMNNIHDRRQFAHDIREAFSSRNSVRGAASGSL